MAGKKASLKPSDFVEGGGVISGVDGTFAEARFAMWDYNGQVPVSNPAVRVKMVDEEKEEYLQYWSAGQAKDWVASDDGKSLLSVGSGSGINTGSNAGILLASVINAGFPEDKMGDDISVLDGLKCHVIRQAAPKRNIQKAPRADGRVFEDTVLIVSKIHQLPWERKGVAGKVAETSGDGLSEKAVGVVMEVLAAAGGSMPKQQ